MWPNLAFAFPLVSKFSHFRYFYVSLINLVKREMLSSTDHITKRIRKASEQIAKRSLNRLV